MNCVYSCHGRKSTRKHWAWNWPHEEWPLWQPQEPGTPFPPPSKVRRGRLGAAPQQHRAHRREGSGYPRWAMHSAHRCDRSLPHTTSAMSGPEQAWKPLRSSPFPHWHKTSVTVEKVHTVIHPSTIADNFPMLRSWCESNKTAAKLSLKGIVHWKKM